MSQPQMSFSEQLQRFCEHTADYRGKYKALILPGTRQHVTSALLIGALEPERVAFLLTDQTRDMPQHVAQELNCSSDGWFIPPGDYSDTNAVYIGIRQVLSQWKDLSSSEIAADVTGGFAPMSVGIAKAAHVLGLATIYILSDYDAATNRIKPGTQQLVLPPDPYTVFGDLEAAEAQRLYTAHDYVGAQRIFDVLKERVSGPDAQRYGTYATLAQAYAAWDVFNWTRAKAALETLLHPALLPDLEPEHTRLQAQLAMLQHLAADNSHLEGEDKNNLFSVMNNLDSVLPLLGTLHANAQRRAAQGRYDVAAMFHYRCLELMSQHRLATYGILTEKPRFAVALRQKPSLKQDYKRVQREQGRRNVYDLPDRPFGLFVGYMLLAALNDPLVTNYPIKNIEERTDARNKSMLAHGFRLITQKEYAPFRGVVDDVLKQFFQVCGRDQRTWEHMCTFLNPFT